MKREECFVCGNEELEVFETKELIAFRCKLCLTKWGRYVVREE